MVTVDELDGVVERIRLDNDEDGAKDLLLVAVHLGRGLKNGRADKVAIGKAGDRWVPPVEQDPAALVFARLDQALDLLSGGGRDERAAVARMQ